MTSLSIMIVLGIALFLFSLVLASYMVINEIRMNRLESRAERIIDMLKEN